MGGTRGNIDHVAIAPAGIFVFDPHSRSASPAVLCFVDSSFPIFGRPKSFDGVRIVSDRTILSVLTKPAILTTQAITELASVLAEPLPPK